MKQSSKSDHEQEKDGKGDTTRSRGVGSRHWGHAITRPIRRLLRRPMLATGRPSPWSAVGGGAESLGNPGDQGSGGVAPSAGGCHVVECPLGRLVLCQVPGEHGQRATVSGCWATARPQNPRLLGSSSRVVGSLGGVGEGPLSVPVGGPLLGLLCRRRGPLRCAGDCGLLHTCPLQRRVREIRVCRRWRTRAPHEPGHCSWDLVEFE